MKLSSSPRPEPVGHRSPFLYPLNQKGRSVNVEEKTVPFCPNGVLSVNQSLIALDWNFSHFLKTDGRHKWGGLKVSWNVWFA